MYWRCVVAFYATSVPWNPLRRHVFFTNTDLPTVDGVNVGQLFQRWGVETVRLPVTHRLPPGRVTSWGNQFFIFDIIDYAARSKRWPGMVVLDSDVIWTSSGDALETAIEESGLITYVHDLDAYPAGARINGVTREELGRFASRHSDKSFDGIVYCGGEIFAATLEETTRIAQIAPELWESVKESDEDAPQEEAHLIPSFTHSTVTLLGGRIRS